MTPATKPAPLSIHLELVLAVKFTGVQLGATWLSHATAKGIDTSLVPGAGVHATLMVEICNVAVEFPKKSPHAVDPSRLANGDGVDGNTPSEHKLAALFRDGRLAT